MQGIVYKYLNDKTIYLSYIHKRNIDNWERQVRCSKDASLVRMNYIAVPIISLILYFEHNILLDDYEIEEEVIRKSCRCFQQILDFLRQVYFAMYCKSVTQSCRKKAL